MTNINKSSQSIRKILRSSNYRTKIYISFASRAYGEDYDSFEENYTDTVLNRKTIYGYVSPVSLTSLVWKEYGLKEQGAVEVVCESKYRQMFERAAKIKIDTKYYTTFRDATSSRFLITDRPMNTIKIVLQMKDEN